jgi:hypothetical protein
MVIALFPFRNPIPEATGCFAGISMHMCKAAGSPQAASRFVSVAEGN